MSNKKERNKEKKEKQMVEIEKVEGETPGELSPIKKN